MIPDTNLNSFYLEFVYNAKADFNKYNEDLKVILEDKEKCYKYIDMVQHLINESFGIVLTKYKEFNDKTYIKSETLYNIAIKKLKQIDDNHPNKYMLLQIGKYCNLLRNEYRTKKFIELAEKRKDIKFSTYRKYVGDYYNKVHKCVLEGMGYKFGYGIGIFVVNYWRVNTSSNSKPLIDFAATNAKKKELKAKGVELYDEKKELWCKLRNIPYNGVDYRVYKDTNHLYEFTFIKSTIVRSSSLEYQRTEYVAQKYRGMSYKDMAETLCKDLDDICDLQVDIKYKLNILLYKDPTKYLNFVRNAEQSRDKYRTYNR